MWGALSDTDTVTRGRPGGVGGVGPVPGSTGAPPRQTAQQAAELVPVERGPDRRRIVEIAQRPIGRRHQEQQQGPRRRTCALLARHGETVSVLQDGAGVVVQPPPVQTVLVIADLEIPGIGNVDVPDVGRGSFWDSDSERLRRCGPGSRSIVARPAATRKAAMPRCTDSGHRGVARTWDEG